MDYFPARDAKENPDYNSVPNACAKTLKSPATDDALMSQTLEVLSKRNITALTSGSPEKLDVWKKAGGERILPATPFDGTDPSLVDLRSWVKSRRVVAFAEIGTQYVGIPIDSPKLEPYFALAEELDVPIGIHVGPGPPGAAYMSGMQNYRARSSSLLSLEEVLTRHPRLRIWAMHAGWPLGDDAIAALYAHPQLYVDLGVIDWFLPRAEFYRYLQRLVDAGFEKRIMFGSDQMEWPDSIPVAIEAIQAAPFLTETQKRDILYNNAARFLRLNPSAN